MTHQFEGLDEADDDGFGARLVIDLGALADNWRMMRDRSLPARCAAVVKADGYGLGIEQVVATLYHAGCRDFFVATAKEGLATRQLAEDARIYVMNCILPGIEADCRSGDLVPVLASMEHVALWTQSCIANGAHPCALQIDTGMNRLGITVEEAETLFMDVTRPAGFSPVLIMSHLSCGDEPDHEMNRHQLDQFTSIANAFPDIDTSLSNSAGVFLGDPHLFNLTRPGIALYGGRASPEGEKHVKPVVTAQSRIITIRHAKTGEAVSYGAAHRLTRATKIAVCSIGYADGYLRSLSGAGTALRRTGSPGAFGYVAGFRVPVIGRVTMDLTMFDITDVPDGLVKSGDFIELFGTNISLDEVAEAADTIGYEILTSMGNRYRRHYLDATESGSA